jgi:hypothetical protein
MLRNALFYSIAQQLLEFHHMHHHCDGLRASCSMEELLTCRPHGRSWFDTDFHMTVEKHLLSSLSPNTLGK